MKDLNILKNNCLDEVHALGIKTGTISEWKINNRAQKRWGLCRAKKDGTFEIQIAKMLLTDDRISEKSCKETIIHEILHTCDHCMKHTGNWKKYAIIMNNTYGYNIKRVTSSTEKGIEEPSSAKIVPKYLFTCRNCGVVIYRLRESKFTRNYRRYRCARCGAAMWSRKSCINSN
ncbi:SprT-like domain-containing protein [Butyrivibrio sp. NC3005]|uniref:SprT-like domain-containing protein n=1 Tax=Butyrivibrio sp. NC3005 TaxID=1280685 RepID=UPI0004254E49|nr:SprT-like domain-containing protein [Butyrivibrio sp. NC3005]